MDLTRRSAGDVVLRVGLISDTHNLLRPAALEALSGCRHILHAGDICASHVIEGLRRLAPVTAVRGNNDRGPDLSRLADWEVVEFGSIAVYVRHDLAELDVDAAAAGFRVVVSGHSHRPAIESRDGVLYVNPGSAGPRRFRLPIAVAELLIAGNDVEARIIELTPR